MPVKSPAHSQFHAITVDLEDWYHVCAASKQRRDSFAMERVVFVTKSILELLHRHQSKATFFVLGSVAEQYPELIEEIARAGHEIASHGWSHRLVTELTPGVFADELLKTADLLERRTGKRPAGFRAPQWSLCPRRTPWAFEILAEQGYAYDSSLTPLAFVGDPSGPRIPHRIETQQGGLWEIPPLVTPTVFGNLPTGGGWGFRFFPEWLIRRTLFSRQRLGQPGVIFIHPRELDPDGPRIALNFLRSFLVYGPRTSSGPRLERLLESFRFRSLGELVSSWQSAS